MLPHRILENHQSTQRDAYLLVCTLICETCESEDGMRVSTVTVDNIDTTIRSMCILSLFDSRLSRSRNSNSEQIYDIGNAYSSIRRNLVLIPFDDSILPVRNIRWLGLSSDCILTSIVCQKLGCRSRATNFVGKATVGRT